MNSTHDEFSDITYNWKQIFADFIEFIINDNNNKYGHTKYFEILKHIEADINIWAAIFLRDFKLNVFIEKQYAEVFKKFVFTYFNKLQFEETQTYTMKQYLKYLCVQLGIIYFYDEEFNKDTNEMDQNEKKWFCNYLIIATSIKFATLHTDLIEQIFNNMLTPSIHLK